MHIAFSNWKTPHFCGQDKQTENMMLPFYSLWKSWTFPISNLKNGWKFILTVLDVQLLNYFLNSHISGSCSKTEVNQKALLTGFKLGDRSLKSPLIFIAFIHCAIHKATAGHEDKTAASILTLFSGILHLKFSPSRQNYNVSLSEVSIHFISWFFELAFLNN